MKDDLISEKFSLYCDDRPAKNVGGFSPILYSLIQTKILQRENLIVGRNIQHLPFFSGFLSIRTNNILYKFFALMVDYLCFPKGITSKHFSECKQLIGFIGRDWTSIFRVFLIARKYKFNTISLVFVDLPDKPIHINFLFKFVIRKFVSSHNYGSVIKAFAVTSTLANYTTVILGIPAKVAPLPYGFSGSVKSNYSSRNSVHTDSMRLVHVGSVSEETIIALKYLTENLNPCLPFIKSAELVFYTASKNIDFSWINSSLSIKSFNVYFNFSDEEIYRLEKENIFFTIYPFHSNNKLSQYSFPSKLFKYFDWGVKTLIFAPANTSFILDSEGRFNIIDLTQTYHDGFSFAFADRKQFATFHSFDNFLATVNE